MAASPGKKTILCDVEAIEAPDLDTVNALARLALVVRRLGLRLELRHVSRELRELLAFTGLLEVLGVEPQREAEEGEERLGVEEERELPNPAG